MYLQSKCLFLGLLVALNTANVSSAQNCSAPGVIWSQADLDHIAQCTDLPYLRIGFRDCAATCNVTSLSPLALLRTIRGDVAVSCCTSLKDFSGLDEVISVGGSLVLYFNQALRTISGFGKLSEVNGSFDISQNVQLVTVSGFPRLKRVGGYLLIAYNQALVNLGFGSLQTIGGEELVAGHAFNILYNGALIDLRGFSSLAAINFGTVHIEGNYKLCYAGYPQRSRSSQFLPRSLTGDQGIDWRQKLRGPQWQYTWNISGLPTLLIQQNGLSCEGASCDSSCGKAGCLGSSNASLCGTCVQIGTANSCDTAEVSTPTSSQVTQCGSTTVAAVLGVFLTIIVIGVGIPLAIAGVYFGRKIFVALKQGSSGVFEVQLTSTQSVMSDMALIASDQNVASLEKEVTSKKNRSTGVVMSSHRPLMNDLAQQGISPIKKETAVKKNPDKSSGVTMFSYKPLQHNSMDLATSPTSGPNSDLKPHKTDSQKSFNLDTNGHGSALTKSNSKKRFSTSNDDATNGHKGPAGIIKSGSKRRLSYHEAEPEAKLISNAARDLTKSTPNKSDSKRRLSFLEGILHSSPSEESLSALLVDGILTDFPMANLRVLKELGSGHFGKVSIAEAKGIQTRNKKLTVVLKQLKQDATSEEREAFISPVEAMKALHHQNVLQLLGMITEGNAIVVMLEYCSHGSFKTFLIRHRTEQSVLKDDGRLIQMACDMAAGLTYLHSMTIAHNDFAVRNCMVSHYDQVKIGDYGLARQMFKEDYYARNPSQLALPIRWMAPEQLIVGHNTLEAHPPFLAGNVWAFGVSLWEVASFSQWPYEEESNEDVIQTLIMTEKCSLENPMPPTDPYCSLYDIMKLCWAPVESRPPMDVVTEMLHRIKESILQNHSTLDQQSKRPPMQGVTQPQLKKLTSLDGVSGSLQSFDPLPSADLHDPDINLDDFVLDPPTESAFKPITHKSGPSLKPYQPTWVNTGATHKDPSEDFVIDPPQESWYEEPTDQFPMLITESMTELDALEEPIEDFILEPPQEIFSSHTTSPQTEYDETTAM